MPAFARPRIVEGSMIFTDEMTVFSSLGKAGDNHVVDVD
jgi:hypothetical protein